MAVDKELFYMSNGIKVKCTADGSLQFPIVKAKVYTEEEVISMLEELHKAILEFPEIDGSDCVERYYIYEGKKMAAFTVEEKIFELKGNTDERE